MQGRIQKYIDRYATWRKKPARFIEDIWSGVKAVSSRETLIHPRSFETNKNYKNCWAHKTVGYKDG